MRSAPRVLVLTPLVNNETAVCPLAITSGSSELPLSRIAWVTPGATTTPPTAALMVPLATIRFLMSIWYASRVAMKLGRGWNTKPTLKLFDVSGDRPAPRPRSLAPGELGASCTTAEIGETFVVV